MGWLNGTPEGAETSDSQSDSSVSPSRDALSGKVAQQTQIMTNLSTMEAAHIHQLQMAEKDMQLAQSENRVSSVERRIRDRDAQVTALREEKAGCMRQIEDLKNQLYQLVSGAGCCFVCA